MPLEKKDTDELVTHTCTVQCIYSDYSNGRLDLGVGFFSGQ